MSDRVVVMFDGAICQCAAPTEIYQRPATRQVANFVGLSNFISGQVVGCEGERRYRVRTALGLLHGVCDTGFRTGDDTLVVVRPESIALHGERPPGTNVFKAEMRERHYLGHTSEFRLACADGNVIQVHQDTLLPASPGTEVWLSFPEERCWLIPPGARGDA